MSDELELPSWARNMADPPHVTKYCGPEDQAVLWYAETTRRRYHIIVGDHDLDLNQQQASALADMLTEEIDG